MTKMFEQLPKSCRSNKDNDSFKTDLKGICCPTQYKFLSRGTKLGCKLLIQIRVGRSLLNSHSYTVGFYESPACICSSSIESPTHFFNDCVLYTEERQTLFSTFEQCLPQFKTFPKNWKLSYMVLMLITLKSSQLTFPCS